MYIKNIKLNNFRNYKKEHVDFHKSVNIILGENAQGKTNLLESIYVTSIGKSFRTFKDKEMVGFDEDYCRIVTTYERDEENKIEISIGKDGTRRGKINGIPIEKRSEILDTILVIVFSPEDLKIVKEDPKKRRNFLDMEISQLSLSYYRSLNLYKKVLLQRNAYLKEKNIDKNILYVWNEKLVEYGSNIILMRDEFIKKISIISNEINKNITEEKEKMDIFYNSNIPVGKNIDSQINIFRDILEKNIEEDIRKETTTNGPHKDDFEIYINKINVRKFGSQGQQRTAALSLKLAEINLIKEEKKENPILLLDDVLSELDASRQRYLVDFLEEIQIFITAADISEKVLKSFPECKIIRVDNGKIY